MPLALRAILTGGLFVAALDLLDAYLVFGLYRHIEMTRILQSIASAVLGPAAYEGGLPTALLGLALHVCVALGIVTAYWAAYTRMPFLRRRVVAGGMLFGVGAYVFMNAVVIPLSAAGFSLTPLSVVNGILGHAFLVGLPAAIAVHRQMREAPALP